MYSALRAMLAYAEANDMIGRTPCRAIRLPRVDLVERPTLSDDLSTRLRLLAVELGPDQGAMMWIGVVLGLRWAECAGLTVGNVNVLRHRLSVVAQLGRSGELGPTKTKSSRRDMAIPEWLSAALATLMARRELDCPPTRRALLFVNEDGGPLDYTNWRRREAWVPARDRTELSGLRFHDLRSLATTALIAEGVDVKTAQTRLGHSSPQVTLAVYARATAHGDRDAADKVGARFGPRDERGMISKLASPSPAV